MHALKRKSLCYSIFNLLYFDFYCTQNMKSQMHRNVKFIKRLVVIIASLLIFSANTRLIYAFFKHPVLSLSNDYLPFGKIFAHSHFS